MRCERLSLTGGPAAAATRIRQLVPSPGSVQDAVAEIIAQVRIGGDEAIREYSRRFDTKGEDPMPLAVEHAELHTAADGLRPDLAAGLRTAIANVDAVAREAVRRDAERTVDLGTHQVILRSAPVARAAVYVPGGRAPYPSTVVMGVVTARAAGVRDVVVCAPPGGDGDVDHTILGAAAISGADRAYRMGGAQAVAALAYGSETVEPVDVIVGPGNLYVQEAKRQVSGHVGIDGFAGPSDLLVIVDGTTATEHSDVAALDLLAQAEHGPGTLVLAVSDDARVLDALAQPLTAHPDTGAVAALIEAENMTAAAAFAQAFAPEHIELIGPAAEALAPLLTHAGCVFVGASAATAFGDYIAGSNHVLPTNGAARFASALSPAQFRRSFTEVRIDSADALARAAAPIARAEGFELHAQSMEARIRDNQG